MSNISIGNASIYFKEPDGWSELMDIQDGVCEIEFADDVESVKKLNSAAEYTFEGELQINREWTLVYCRECRQPIPIIKFDRLIYGSEGWTCPLCSVIARRKRVLRNLKH